MRLARERGGTLITVDANLAKVAEALRVPVAQINALASKFRVPYAAGDEISVRLVKEGREHGQGVGYLDDGTMVVVEEVGHGADRHGGRRPGDERHPDHDRPHGIRRRSRGVGRVTEGLVTAVILAAGSGRRLGADEPKAFLWIGGRPLVSLSAAAAAASPAIGSLVVAVPAGMEQRAKEVLAEVDLPVTVVMGGAFRHESVARALDAVPAGSPVVVCHDAARPFAPPDLFAAVVEAVDEHVDAAIPVVPIADTVKRVLSGRIVGTEAREGLALAQTPQAFNLSTNFNQPTRRIIVRWRAGFQGLCPLRDLDLPGRKAMKLTGYQ